jgi:hypothetical protein
MMMGIGMPSIQSNTARNMHFSRVRSFQMQTRAKRNGSEWLESVWKLYSGGHLPAFSALPVITDPNVRCAPVLENTVI